MFFNDNVAFSFSDYSWEWEPEEEDGECISGKFKKKQGAPGDETDKTCLYLEVRGRPTGRNSRGTEFVVPKWYKWRSEVANLVSRRLYDRFGIRVFDEKAFPVGSGRGVSKRFQEGPAARMYVGSFNEIQFGLGGFVRIYLEPGFVSSGVAFFFTKDSVSSVFVVDGDRTGKAVELRKIVEGELCFNGNDRKKLSLAGSRSKDIVCLHEAVWKYGADAVVSCLPIKGIGSVSARC